MRKFLIAVSLCLSACGHPTEQVRTLDERPSILVNGAPAGAVLQVDGLIAGAVNGASGAPQAIRVEPGTHTIDVLNNGASIMHDRLFVSGGVITTVTVPSGGGKK
jgi:hypothetical protein